MSNVRSTFASKHHKVQLQKPGTYVIRTKVRWDNKQTNTFTLSAYASIKLELNHIPTIKHFLKNLFTKCSRFGNKREMKNNCSGVYENYSNYVYMFFRNKGDRTWVLEVQFTKLDNLKFAKTVKNAGNSVKLSIPPGGKEIIYMKAIDPRHNIRYDQKIGYKFQ